MKPRKTIQEIEEEAFCLGIINKFTIDTQVSEKKISFNQFLDLLMLKKKKHGSYCAAIMVVQKEYDIDDDFWPRLKSTKFGECLMEELMKKRHFGKPVEIQLF